VAAIAACGGGVEPAPPPTATVAPPAKVVAPPADASSPDAADIQEDRFALLRFHRDTLASCIEAEVARHRKPGVPVGLSGAQLALLIAQDGDSSIERGDGLLSDATQANALPKFTEMLAKFAFTDLVELQKKSSALLDVVRWPPKEGDIAEAFKRGDVASADGCTAARRAPLASCVIEDQRNEADRALVWRMTWFVFDPAAVTGSDAALKICTKLRGKWTPKQR
jgi:hypothetical protein